MTNTSRYSVRWENGSVLVLDSFHKNLTAGVIQLERTVDGNGWRFMSRTQTRNSRAP